MKKKFEHPQNGNSRGRQHGGPRGEYRLSDKNDDTKQPQTDHHAAYPLEIPKSMPNISP